MKKLTLLLLAFVLALGLFACKLDSIQASDFVGKAYIRQGCESSAFAGSGPRLFFSEDGTWSCSDFASSIFYPVGSRNWTLEDGVLILTETKVGSDTEYTYCFQIDGNCLIYQSKDPADLGYIIIKSGDRF